MKKIKIFPSKSTVVVTAFVSIILFSLFDTYISDLSKETMKSWLKAEEIDILQDNLLTSVSKYQRTLTTSEFLKGVVLVDWSKPSQLEQVNFGEKIDLEKIRNEHKNIEPQTITTGLFKKYVFATIKDKPNMTIIFSVWSSGFIEIFWFSCILIAGLFVVQIFVVSYVRHQEHLKREKQTAEFAEKAARMAHDIRSPVMILDSLANSASEDNELKEKLSFVVGKLRHLTNEVIEPKQISKVPQKNLLAGTDTQARSVLDEIKIHFESKKIQYKDNKRIQFKSDLCQFNGRLKIGNFELTRALSNLIDNAVDAIENHGEVKIHLQRHEDNLILKIIDTGKGIPQNILPSVGSKDFTYGKKFGSGLGVYYSKSDVENCGGSLEIDSVENQGTTVTLKIPISKNAVLNENTVQIESGSNLLIIDDDPLIRQTWNLYLKDNLKDNSISVKIYSSLDEIMADKLNPNNSVLLTDFDLQEKLNGLDLIVEKQFQGVSLLVTGMASDVAVQARANSPGVPVLSKDRLNTLKIVTI